MKKTLCFCLYLSLITFVFGLMRNGVEFVYSHGYLIPMDLSDSVITPETARVVSVVDGDTIKVVLVSGTESVRLIGVDTPETVHPTKAVEAFGKEASDFLKKLCKEGQDVYLSYDWNPRDVYNRLLAYLWLKSDDGKWVFANLAIVENGYGRAYLNYAFRKDYMTMFSDAQQTAREKGYGLWGGAAVSSTTTVQQTTPVSIPSSSEKYIGNIKSKVFYRLTCDLLPDEKNRVYFNTREEAIADGGKWVFANLAIVENGDRHAYLNYAFLKDYVMAFSDAQQIAREKGYGLWGTTAVSSTTTVQQTTPVSIPSSSQKFQYIGNIKSKVFHRLTCSSLPDEKNRVYLNTREEAITAGYKPCGNCNP